MATLAAVSPQSTPTLFHLIVGQPPTVWQSLLLSVILLAVVFIPLVLMIAMFCIWWERKVAGHIQSRIGPNRVGPIGLLQSLADGIKLLSKEDLAPRDSDKFLFRLAPYVAFTPAFAAFLALPFAPLLVFEPRLNSGVFWILAILSVEIMGIILAGWASNNKWAIYGAMREACQMVSYEIPLGIAIIIGVMSAGTLNLVQLGHLQSGGLHTWIIFRNPFVSGAFLVYFIASLASNKRAPFDLPESESELVAGYHTEYSGMRFAFFFFAEYAGMFVVGGIQAALFLGGWNDPFGLMGYYFHRFASDPQAHVSGMILLNLFGFGIFTSKCLAIIFLQMWLRWTLPRPRIDQVLYTCIKVLLPAAGLLLIGASLWELFIPERDGLPWVTYQPFTLAGWEGAHGALITQTMLALLGLSFIGLIMFWAMLAISGGSKVKKRLTEAAPIP